MILVKEVMFRLGLVIICFMCCFFLLSMLLG